MKTKISILFLMLAFAFGATAQSIGDYMDVVYLKNGSVVKGVIIEQVPGQSIKIQTNEGKILNYSIYDVAKFTREANMRNSSTTTTTTNSTSTDGKTCSKSKEACASKSSCKSGSSCASGGKSCCGMSKMFNGEYKQKDKGHFAEFSLGGNSSAYSFRITNGYKFGKRAQFGLAVGLENVALNTGERLPEISLNLIYAGDLMNRKITPFYQVEAGYGFSLDRYGYNSNLLNGDNFFSNGFGWGKNEIDFNDQSASTLNYGGPQGAILLGVKFHTQKKIYYKLGLDARLTSNFSDVHFLDFDNSGLITGTTINKEFDVNPGIGARFTIGF